MYYCSVVQFLRNGNLQSASYPTPTLQEWQKKQAETILLTITQSAKLPFFS